MRMAINKVGAIGVVRDTDMPPEQLPPEAWSSGTNVRFQDGKAIKCKGNEKIYNPPTVAPHWLMPTPTTTAAYWVYAGLNDVYAVESSTHSKITRSSGTYTANVKSLWNGGMLGSVPILNNGVDAPQFWAKVDVSTLLADLTNWPSNVVAKVVRPFNQHLVALNVQKNSGANLYPHMIKWSHPADPNAVPSSWDETDPTKDAGEWDLADADAGVIQDGLRLRKTFVVYKEGSTWGMLHIGGTFIFKVFNIFETSGILATDCVASIPRGGGHFVATGDDVIVHDGQRANSIVDRRWRRFISNNIDTDNYDRSFCVPNEAEREMWFCFPEVGNTLPTLALVWDITDGSLGVRSLSGFSYMGHGHITGTSPASDQWNNDTQAWNLDTTLWSTSAFSPFTRIPVGVHPGDTEIHKFDSTDQNDGADMTVLLERTGLGYYPNSRDGTPIFDLHRRKLCHRVWLNMTGGPVTVSVGSQEEPNEAVTYSTGVTFTPGTDKFIDIDPVVDGALLAIKIESSADVAWELESYSMDIKVLGEQ